MKQTIADLIIHSAAEVVTCQGPQVAATKTARKAQPPVRNPRRGAGQGDAGIVPNGAIAIKGERIVGVGTTDDILPAFRGEETTLLDASGKTVTPGLVDAHTHLAWAGWRDEEYELRLKGATYLDIMEAGGGIMSTVRATRLVGEDELKELMRERLARMLTHGTTTVEIKSGYGLSVEAEMKSLWAIRDLNIELQASGTGPRIAATFLGAHAVPEEYADRSDDYVKLVTEKMLPAVAEEGLAEWCDAFCDVGAFTAEQTRTILSRAKELGLGTRLHANEFARVGAIEVATEMGAASADHLLVMNSADIEALKRAGTIAVLLPGTPLGLGLKDYAPARALIDAGVPVALATDCNPGTCPSENLALMISLACSQMKMTPAEAIVAATINSAYALDRGHVLGSLEAGKLADIVIWNAPSHRHIAYHFGVNLAEAIFIGGALVAGTQDLRLLDEEVQDDALERFLS
ncbi:MAG TPA: imidazolonepropionase [Chloroflexia bacterium]|nr:imidazolonepropionase [Chloroflexia bacterium]